MAFQCRADPVEWLDSLSPRFTKSMIWQDNPQERRFEREQ